MLGMIPGGVRLELGDEVDKKDRKSLHQGVA